jgi:uncharacterized protein
MLLRRRTVLSSLVSAAVLPALARAETSPEITVPATADVVPGPVAAPAVVPAPVSAATVPAAPAALPVWRRFAVPVAFNDPRPKIAIVIDDLGVMHAHTQAALNLPGPLTLAWFPFAPDLQGQVEEGAARGHEAMLHMPMQAGSDSLALAWTGPDPLRVDLPMSVNLDRLRTALSAVPQIVGLNNHMGSVATRDPALMSMVAEETSSRTMLFLDSLVIPHSAGLRCAQAVGVPSAGRDVFIDNTANTWEIHQQLATTEAIARRIGYAIAIGHPRPHTLEALAEWLPTLPEKGFVLWPISATIALRNHINLSAAA